MLATTFSSLKCVITASEPPRDYREQLILAQAKLIERLWTLRGHTPRISPIFNSGVCVPLPPVSSEQITALLVRWSQGDEHALDEVITLVYSRLRRMAAWRMNQKERKGHTLQPSDLVNEAFLKLNASARVQWKNRAHFYAVASRAMRQVLVDHARKRKAIKREVEMVPLDE